MQGSLIKRGKYWHAVFDVPTVNGKRKQVSKSTKQTNHKKAQKILNEWINQIYKGEFIEPQKQKFEDFLKDWLEVKKGDVSPGTYYNYKTIIEKHINPHLGEKNLQEIKPLHIQNFYNEKKKELSSHRVKNIHTVVSSALNYAAVNLETIPRNPSQNVALPKTEEKEMNVIESKHDMDKFIKRLEQYGKMVVTIYVLLGMYAGLRRGEAAALKWSNVDLKNKTVSIKEQLTARGGTQKPKCGSDGVIKMPDKLVNYLKKHKAQQTEYKMFIQDLYQDNDLVLCGETGKPVSYNTLGRYYLRFLRGNPDLPQIRYHDLRHTYVTWLIKSGAHPKTVQKMARHSTIKITLDRYGHVTPDMQDEAIENFQRKIK